MWPFRRGRWQGGSLAGCPLPPKTRKQPAGVADERLPFPPPRHRRRVVSYLCAALAFLFAFTVLTQPTVVVIEYTHVVRSSR